jgi:hypothetical protein
MTPYNLVAFANVLGCMWQFNVVVGAEKTSKDSMPARARRHGPKMAISRDDRIRVWHVVA